MIDKDLIRQAAEDIDIFEADLTEEYDRIVRPSRIVRLWPLAAAACAAGLVAIFLMPPRMEKQQPETVNMADAQSEQSLRQEMLCHEELRRQFNPDELRKSIIQDGERLGAYIRQQKANLHVLNR